MHHVKYYNFSLYKYYALVVEPILPSLTKVLLFSELQDLKSVICVHVS